MKNCIVVLLVLLLTFFTGCSQVPSREEIATATIAVDPQLIDLYGSDWEEVKDLYGLSEDNKDETWTDYYLGKEHWCGTEQETKFLFTDNKLTFAKTKMVIDNNTDSKEMVASVISKFSNQFGDPESILTQFDWIPEPKQDYQENSLSEQEELFWEAETGALLCLSFTSENVEDPHYIECVFLRNESKNPREIHIVLQMGDASFGYISEDIDLNAFS